MCKKFGPMKGAMCVQLNVTIKWTMALYVLTYFTVTTLLSALKTKTKMLY